MQLVFNRNCFEQDLNSIYNILILEGKHHDKVKCFICDSFGIDFNELQKLNQTETKKLLYPLLRVEYEKSQPSMDEKLEKSVDYWSKIQSSVTNIFTQIFGTDYLHEQTISANLSINYVCPYDYKQHTFDINYRKTADEIIECCIHELIHFYWFQKWDEVFGNKYNEYQHLIWKFSELSIDALFKETALKDFCIKEKPAHQYFYDVKIGQENLIDIFRKLFAENNIIQFMKKGFEFLKTNEDLITD